MQQNNSIGVWLSLVERMVRDHEAGGSNPLTPTISKMRRQTVMVCRFLISTKTTISGLDSGLKYDRMKQDRMMTGNS